MTSQQEPTEQMIRDVAYTDPDPASTEGNLLDVYRPAGGGTARSPVLVWTTGSAWLADDGKSGAPPIAAEFNARGYTVVGVSLRSSAQTTFPGQLHDIRAAIRFLRSNADLYRIDPDRIAIMGNSSGGWTAAMASVTSNRHRLDGEPEVGDVSSAVQAAVAFFPPVDFLSMDAQTIEQRETYGIAGDPIILHDDPASPESLLVGGPIQDRPEAAAAASPLAYATGSEPPTAIFHGTHDPLLPPGQSTALYEALRDAGARVQLTLVHGSGHEVIPPSADAPPRLFEVGDPIIGATEFTTWGAGEGVEQAGTGLPPTWDAIAEFISGTIG